MMRKFWITLLALGLLLSFSLALALAQPPFTIERVSVASDGTQGNGSSGAWELPSIALSADGRFVAFVSHASNLVPGDTNGVADVFVRDRLTSATTRVSVASDGSQGNDSVESYGLALSADGRFVAFVSRASNLAPGDTNGVADIFLHDRLTVETTRVSVATDGTQADQRSRNPVLSADGRFVAFQEPRACQLSASYLQRLPA